MSEREDKPTTPVKPKSGKDRLVKVAFLIIALSVAGVVYMMQRKDPELTGWDKDLGDALKRAKADQKKVVVLFTRSPMSHDDKKIVNKCVRLPPSVRVLRHLGYPKVHLTIQGDRKAAERYDVHNSPTVLLLDSDGKILKRRDGFMTDLAFCNDMLGLPAAAVPKANSSADED